MSAAAIRDAIATDFDAIVAVNAAEEQHTSPMDRARLEALHALAAWHRVATVEGSVAAFLLAMGEGCGYANANFEWFTAHGSDFLYVDRIVVGRRFQGLGLGTLLYRDLFAHARASGIARIACEYNIVPPNDPSRVFHDRFGFEEAGRQWLVSGTKQVSMQIAVVA